MEADFSGWATKAGLKCSDGRTIMPDAFKDQDSHRVPLVWAHGHSEPENVLGHVLLENRPEGVYAYGFFNDSERGQHTKGLVQHKDITCLSIWANQLIERTGKVLHGAIREVSLVLSGANPGARIDNVTISHGEGLDDEELPDEAIIHTGLELDLDGEFEHAEGDGASDGDEKTIEDVWNSMTEEQQTVTQYMVGEALESATEMKQSAIDEVVDEAVTEAVTEAIKHYDEELTKLEGLNNMTKNVFEQEKATVSLSHNEMQAIVESAKKSGSMKDAVQEYALAHNITDIDQLFPEARTISDVPEFLKRRVEWVASFTNGTRKSPFSRIKTLHADITEDEARAKGYIKGNLKREEFFAVTKRITLPTTVYKKQQLDRDDMIDITDFDVVTWLKGEMRIMLDEELARAALIGDGRDVSHEDKINEGNIRPIAKDHELYVTYVNVNLDDSLSTVQEVIDQIVLNRRHFRGTGTPNMYTTETYISKFLLLKDTTGRKIYRNLDELAAELRVAEIIPVEVMEEEADLVCVIVNPVDYVMGADKGGSVTMFDDFDIDYNKYKYLIETRMCGALVKLKSAIVVKKVVGTLILATPQEPGFVSDTGVVTIPTVTGVVYKQADGTTTINAGAMTALAANAKVTIKSVPAAGYYFGSTEDDQWTFQREAV